MKHILLVTSLFLSAQAFAVATLKVPVFVETNKKVPAAVANKDAAAEGLTERLPIFVTFADNKDNEQTLEDLGAQVQVLMKKLGAWYKHGELATELYPTQNNYKTLVTCYTGKPEDVIELVYNLTDAYFSEQMTLEGWKYKKETHYSENLADDEDGQKFLSEGSQIWRDFKGNSEDLLILASVGDGGDDIQESVIQKCK